MEMSPEQINQAQTLENGMREAEQHLEFIENQISELSAFNSHLDSFSKSNEKKILSSIGKGVYVNTELKDKNLLVEVGKGIMINKSPESVQETVKGQIKKLSEAREYLQNQMDLYINSLNSLINTIQVKD